MNKKTNNNEEDLWIKLPDSPWMFGFILGLIAGTMIIAFIFVFLFIRFNN